MSDPAPITIDYRTPPPDAPTPPARRGRVLFIICLWLIALALAGGLDRPVAQWVHAHGMDAKAAWNASHKGVVRALKLPGDYLLTLLVAVLLGLFHRQHWRAAGFLLLAGLVSGVNGLLKWIVGRHRPVKGIHPFHFDWFVGGIKGLFHQKDLSFPSGHACLAFASAAALAILLPRWRGWFYAVAAFVAAERIFENAHYVSDAVAGAGIGVLAAYGTWSLLRRIGPRPVFG